MGLPAAVEKKVHRQAAIAIGKLLEADEKKQGGASIKTLTLAPGVVAKKATYALTCETLRYLPVLKPVLESTSQLRFSQHLRPELAYVLVYDLLFGQGLSGCAPHEKVVLACKSALRASLARLLVKHGVSSAAELLPAESQRAASTQPRYARINPLKTTLEDALRLLRSSGGAAKSAPSVEQDPLIPNLLVFPPGTDLHDHAMVKDGRLILQGKASCMPAQALHPDPSWTVIDACAAPGNKTIHLAALMGNKGKIIACDADARRLETLKKTVKKAGAKNIDARHQDFLKLDPEAPEHLKVRAILLDPSCSGSGTRLQRMDHLLPSSTERTLGESDPGTPYEPATPADRERVEKLASFQEAAVRHALRFPGLQRLVYSTCSVHRRENEDVVSAVLPTAREKGFRLAPAFPGWPHRGLPVVEGAQHLVRTDAARDQTDGFFVALFERGSGKKSAARGKADASSDISRKRVPPTEKDGRGVPAVNLEGRKEDVELEREAADVAESVERDDGLAEPDFARRAGKRKRKQADNKATGSKRDKQSRNGRGVEPEGALGESVKSARGKLATDAGKTAEGTEDTRSGNGDHSNQSASNDDLEAEPCGTARESLLRRRKAKRERKKAQQRTSQAGEAS